MGITRLKRKARRNKQTAAKRQNSIQQLNRKPVIKNIDKEAIKATFTSAPAAPAKEEAPAPVEEVQEPVAETVEATPEAVEETVEEVTAEAQAEEAAPEAEETTDEAEAEEETKPEAE